MEYIKYHITNVARMINIANQRTVQYEKETKVDVYEDGF